MEIFKIWSTFDLKGNALQKIEQFSKLTKSSAENTKLLTKQLNLLSTAFATVELNSKNVVQRLSKISTLFTRLNEKTLTAKDRLNAFDRSVENATNKTRALVGSAGELANNLSHVALAGDKAAIALGGVRSAKIGTSIGRSGGASSRSGAGSFSGNSFLTAGLLGIGAPAIGAFGAISFLKNSFDVSSKYQVMQGQLTALGYTPQQISQANQFVMGSNIKGVSKLQMMQAYIDAQMATRENPNEAVGANSEVKRFAPILAKSQFAANIMYGGMSSGEEQNLIRFADTMGGSSLQRREQFLDAAMQIMVSSGGSIRPTELRTFARQAGGAFSNLSPAALVGLEPVFQESGGAKLATGLVTGLRQLITGTGSNFNKKQVGFLEHIGLLNATYDSEGRPLGVHMPSQYAKVAGTDPFLFLTQVILPLMKQAKINISDPNTLMEALTLGFGRTYSNQLQIMDKSMLTIQRQRDQLSSIGGVDTQYGLALKMNAAAPQMLGAAWSDFSKAIGDLTSPLVTIGLKALAGSLEFLANIATAFHNLAWSQFPGTLQKNQGTLGSIWHAGNLGNLAQIKNNQGFYSSMIQSSSSAISSASKPTSNSSATVNLHMDGKKVGTGLMPFLTNMLTGGGVSGGTAFTNVGLTPTSINYNSPGTP